ncbi:MAG: hypothetical protein AVDCRST_MAG19-2099 [uncultured Thermomicrobiales bacterium]|uniref:Cytochrome c domain-containing protein n=1 Tax=uncultured Thermomicrobiales bacterium TaxID=1645740 RepID=A0A6J4UYW3_9BACT|nr:MAG: hypothetical protein AVDCRST_MAG19-2099 [uncultured Thermomicrobiales bacterium]
MGAVQKLATVVIVGLVALASVLVVYLADEPNRRAAEAAEQEEVAVERGISTYLNNCVTCHGPGGEGLTAQDGRIGLPLGGNTRQARAAQEVNQSQDPIERQQRYDLIVETLHQGRNAMPAFGRGAEGGAVLNDEEIHELATMIQHVDWDLVYNDVIAANDGVYPPAPPTTPAAAAAQAPAGAAAAPAAPPAGAPPADGAAAQAPAAPAATLEGYDIGWRLNGQDSAAENLTLTVAPGSTISLPNVGASLHNFAVDDLGVSVDMPVGQTVEATIPADAPAGQYEFYCNVPGHKALMNGILVIDSAAAPPAAAQAPAGATPAEGTPAPAGAPPAEQAAVPTLEGYDIGWRFEGQDSASADVTITVAPGAKIPLLNAGVSPHNFAVDAFDNMVVDMPIGQTVEATIPADAAPGEYEFYCNVPGHKALMTGTLIVQ